MAVAIVAVGRDEAASAPTVDLVVVEAVRLATLVQQIADPRCAESMSAAL
jgi:hypothetical protein